MPPPFTIDLAFFQTKDITLDIFQDHHTPALCKKAQDPRIWKHHHIAFDDPAIFKAEQIDKAKKDIANHTRYMFVIYYQGDIIGSTSYYDINQNHKRMYIGYTWLHPDYWGKGINPIVKNQLLTYAFEQLNYQRIAFCIDSENTASRRAVEKLGASFEGILKKHQIRPDGSNRDSSIYAITDDTWKKRKAKAYNPNKT